MWREIGTFPFPRSQTGIAREWAGPIGDFLFVLRQTDPQPPDCADDPVWYRVHSECTHVDADDSQKLLNDYFRANMDHTKMMQSFCEADTVFSSIFPYYKGLRTLRVHPEECLFAFICSSNNNIKRITTLVTHLARTYGQRLATHGDYTFHAFPSTETLATEANEEDLREAGFGYRAKFIPATARELSKLAAENHMRVQQLLLSWRNLPRKEVSDKLVRFAGIGRKVAGCIALMSLNQHGEIPVDTHVWQISKRYMPDLEGRSLTDRVYDRIGEFFRMRFGEEVAGLAHNVLFIAELSDFKNLVPSDGEMGSGKSSGKSSGKGIVRSENGVLNVGGVKKVKRITKKKSSEKSGEKAERSIRNTHGQNGVRKKNKELVPKDTK
ncbi:unnamed protein product [Agarophyton chilense]